MSKIRYSYTDKLLRESRRAVLRAFVAKRDGVTVAELYEHHPEASERAEYIVAPFPIEADEYPDPPRMYCDSPHEWCGASHTKNKPWSQVNKSRA
jgi:hypothetical protein